MIVAITKAARHEADSSKIIQDEHLLERISVLENNFARLTDRVSDVLELLMKHSQSLSFDHSLLETLIVLLCEAGQINPVLLKTEWNKRRQQPENDGQQVLRVNTTRREVIEAFKGIEAETFKVLAGQGFDLIKEDKLSAGINVLEKAAALDPENSLLNFILGRHFYKEGKLKLAESYLERALNCETPVIYVNLLLGLVCDELGYSERAHQLLIEAQKILGPIFPGEIILGKLAAIEGRWTEALKHFKKARAIKPCLEADYLLGLAYFARGFNRAALRSLSHALENDLAPAEIYFLTGLIFAQLKERKAAKALFRSAVELAPDNAYFRCMLAKRNVPPEVAPDALRLLKVGGRAPRKGSFFWAETVIADALAISAVF